MDNEFEDCTVLGGEPHPMETLAKEIGSEGIGLMSTLMDQSRRETDRITALVEENDKTEIEHWKKRALEAEHRLYLVEQRVLNFFFAETSPFDPEVYD